MAERKRNRKKKEQAETLLDDGKPMKEEYAVAKFLRQKLPEKKTMLLGHKVDYFIASRAIDCLLDSPWATKSGKQEALFTTRDSIVEFMDRMLQHKFFHRAKKIIVQKEPKKKKKEDDTTADSSKEGKDKKDKKSSVKDKELKDKKEPVKEKESIKEKEPEKKEKESIKEKETKELLKESSTKDKESSKESDKKDSKAKEEKEKSEDKKEGEKDEKKKEKKKIKLDMHLEQLFLDGNEAYVWIYDPIPVRAWIVGMLLVIGAVLVCLFPLWPQSIRHYIYYLSVAAAFFLVFIIGLAIIRLIVFVIIWTITIGKHHLWLLPNLTEDVGFFESFWPLYKYEYKGTPKEKKDSKQDEENEEEHSEKKRSKKTKDKDSAEKSEKSDSNTDHEKEDQMHSELEQESDNDDKIENGDKTDNGFEILDPEDEETQHHKKCD